MGNNKYTYMVRKGSTLIFRGNSKELLERFPFYKKNVSNYALTGSVTKDGYKLTRISNAGMEKVYYAFDGDKCIANGSSDYIGLTVGATERVIREHAESGKPVNGYTIKMKVREVKEEKDNDLYDFIRWHLLRYGNTCTRKNPAKAVETLTREGFKLRVKEIHFVKGQMYNKKKISWYLIFDETERTGSGIQSET